MTTIAPIATAPPQTAPHRARPGTLPDPTVGEIAAPRTRREQILDDASAVFAQTGYHGSSLRQIASRVGISHPGMLHHFGSKELLLAAVIDRLEACAQKSLDQIEELCADPDSFATRIATLYDPRSAPIQLLAVLDSECVSTEHPGRFRIARLRRVHEYVLAQCFERLIEMDRFRPGTDPLFAARAVVSVVMGQAAREETVRHMQTRRDDDDPQEDLRRLVLLFLVP